MDSQTGTNLKQQGEEAARLPHLMLLGGGFLIIATVVLLIGWTILQGRDFAYRDAKISTANISQTLADNVNNTIRQIDNGLLAILDEVSLQQKRGAWDDEEMRAVIARQDERNPETPGFRIFGADGKLRYAVSNVVNRSADNSQREDFKYLRDTPNCELLVTPPLIGNTSGKPLIAVARRFNNPDGSFGGVAYGTIPISILEKKFASLDFGLNGAVGLYHSSFRLAARVPHTGRTDELIGTPALGEQLRAIIASGVQDAHYDYLSAVDSVRRTAHVKRVEGQPYYVLAAEAEDDFLADWRRTRNSLLLFCVGIVIVILAGMFLIDRRITEREAANEKLRVSEEQMRLFFERQIVGMAITSPRKGWMKVNDQLCRMLGYAREELDHLTWAGLTHPDDLSADTAQFERVLSGEIDEYSLEKRFFRKNGEVLWTELSVGCVRTKDGSIDYILALLSDITARKQGETDLLEKSRDLEQFTHILAHHLQEPVRLQVNFSSRLSQLLEGKELTTDIKRTLDHIIRGGNRLYILLRDVRHYLEVSQAPLQPDRCSTQKALETALATLASKIAETKAAVHYGDLPNVKIADGQMANVFIALIGNSLFYTRDGVAPVILIEATQEGHDAIISIDDNGIGIPEQFRNRVFNVFERLHSDQRQPGTGIGLALVRKIIVSANGKVWIETSQSGGVRLCLSLPRIDD
ncbi:MAG TPA: PAS domain S-box protein [Rhodospirillaceae bacterium]|nr:PAS domain S-box protein [Rhodospirillaceae bacterium]